MMKITIPAVVSEFADYYRRNPCWGAFHVVLDDGNVRDVFMEGAREKAEAEGDHEVARLALLLEQMTPTQRRKLPYAVGRYLANPPPLPGPESPA